MRRARMVAPVLALWFLLSPSEARAGGTYTVDRTDDDASAFACLDATPDDCSLRGAIRAANQDGVDSEVILPDGLYRLTLEGPNDDGNLTGDLDVFFDGLTLRSAPGSHPVIEQVTDDRILHYHANFGDMVLQGPMTLLGGFAHNTGGFEAGGSVNFFRSGSFTVTGVDFVGGFAPDDGG